jgi:carboxypeptidase Taq
MSAYRALEARFREIADLEGALAVLHWDQQVMMPEGGAEARGQQIATLEQIAHGLMVAPETRDWLEAAQAEALEPWAEANRREMRRHVVHASAVPTELVGALALATARAEQAWRKARAAADFGLLRPALAEVLTLIRAKAAAKAEALGLAPYDALLDTYEPGVRMAAVDSLLGALETALPGLIEQAIRRQTTPLPLPGPLPTAAQKALGQRLMTALGFDFAHGRLDESLHPFCGGVPDDIRMTARYDDVDVASGLMAILHETGHALYNAGLPQAWRRQPVGEPRSYALHESQSLLIEMQVCRSRAFLSFLAPLLQQAYGRPGDPALAPDNLYRRAIRVSRSLIRVDADEMTYPLHIILRYRLEQALLGGTLEVADLHAAWHDGMRDLLGIVPPDDRLGCLQDIHWAGGAFGYFPCYTLGALIAAQLFEALASDHPDLEERLAVGDFTPLLAWLRSNVHERGCLLEPADLVTEATGRPLQVEPFLRHLEHRYLS